MPVSNAAGNAAPFKSNDRTRAPCRSGSWSSPAPAPATIWPRQVKLDAQSAPQRTQSRARDHWTLRSALPKRKCSRWATHSFGDRQASEQVTAWERVETGVRDAAALTMTFMRHLRRARSGRSGHSNARRERMPPQAARPSMPSSSGSLPTRASGSLSWPTAPATHFSTLPCCRRPDTTPSIRKPS